MTYLIYNRFCIWFKVIYLGMTEFIFADIKRSLRTTSHSSTYTMNKDLVTTNTMLRHRVYKDDIKVTATVDKIGVVSRVGVSVNDRGSGYRKIGLYSGNSYI